MADLTPDLNNDKRIGLSFLFKVRLYLKRRLPLLNFFHLASRLLKLEYRVEALSLAHEFQLKNLELEIFASTSKNFDKFFDKSKGSDTFNEINKEVNKSENLKSEPCKAQHFRRPEYLHWVIKMKQTPVLHRKQWEWFFIAQALSERGLLQANSNGLGFAVGQEPLPALFASFGCQIVASDASTQLASRQGWQKTHEHASGLFDLNSICAPNLFAQNASFRFVDMNHIPSDLVGFDFCWSSCALEHLGSIAKGLEFIENSLAVLRPGGIAVHTTELNVSDLEKTIEVDPASVLFRAKDIESLATKLAMHGHKVIDLNTLLGQEDLDKYVDVNAQYFHQDTAYLRAPHLKYFHHGFVTTSIGIIIQKAV